MPKLASLDASRVGSMCDNSVSVLSNLTELFLECLTDITNEGIVTICHNNPRLKVLSLALCSIDDTGNIHICLFLVKIQSPGSHVVLIF